MAKVEVSRGLLVGLGAALAAVTLALAFVLGRTTAHPAPAPAAGPVQPSPVAQPAADPPPREAPVSMPAAGPQLAPQLPVPARPGPDPQREAVAAYFRAVDQIQPGQMGGDPEAMARGILGGLVKGDSTGFDGMIRQAEEARDRLAALTPPAPCAGYHQESLAMLADSLGMLRSIKGSLQGSGAPAADFTAQANRLRTRAEALQAQEQQLRRRYGLGQ